MDYFITFSNKYQQLFESDPNIKYIEIDTYRKCYYDTPYNPDKFESVNGKIRCKPETTEVHANDLPLLHYYSRDMVEHSVTDISEMFRDCILLESIDTCAWNTETVIDMYATFANCHLLKSINLSNWNTQNVQNMSNMFCNCELLKFLDVSKWNICSVTDMSYMFYNCKQLELIGVNKWIICDTHRMFTIEDKYNKIFRYTSIFNNDSEHKPSWYH